MTHLRLFLALGVLLVLPRAAGAQTPGEGSGVGAFVQLPNGDWVPRDHPAAQAAKAPFPLYGYIDSPDPLAKADYTVGFQITGWHLDCRNGQQPPFVAILVDNRWITSYAVERALPRPDVRDRYLAACPAIGANTAFGYTLRLNEPLNPGGYWLTVFWNDGADRSRGESRFVVVK